MRRLLLLTACLMLSGVTAWAAPKPSPMPDDPKAVEAYHHFSKGKAAFDDGRWKEAIEAFEKGLKLQPLSVDGLYYLGLAYEADKQYEPAEKAFKKIIELNSKATQVYIQLANVYLETNRFADARQQMKTVIGYDANNFQAYYVQGVIAYMEGKLDEAINHWERTVKLYDNFEPARYNLGWAYYNSHNLGQALVQLKKAVSLKPFNDLYQFGLGWVSYTVKDGTSAERAFDQVLRTGKDGAPAHAVLCYRALQKKDYAEALKQGKTCVDKDPRFVKAWLMMARAHQAQNDVAGAHQAAEAALKADPNDFESKDLLKALPPAPTPSPSPSPAPSP